MEKKLTKEELTEIAELVEGSARDDYSGRGMFGERCIGISTGDEFSLGVAACSILGAEKAKKLSRATRTDSMGRDTIVYWPGWSLSNGPLEEEEEDCDECGATIPENSNGGLANKHHSDSCSLYDPDEE